MTTTSSIAPPAAPVELWAAQVAAHATLPDHRLNARWADVLACLAAKPADSIPQACRDWGQAKATYRFLENPRVHADDLLMSFVKATVQSCRESPVVYAVHDSTSFNYSSLKQTTGLGLLNDIEHARGIHLHTTLALQPNGVPLGVLHQQYWVRPPGQMKRRPQQRPIEDRESFKWLEGLTATEAALAELPATERPRLIHVMDREGDIHEVLQHLATGRDSAVIRCGYNRKVAGEPGYAHPAVQAAPLLGHHPVTVRACDRQPAREAKLEVRRVPVVVEPACHVDRTRRPVACMLVEAREVEVPPGVTEPLHWFLWTFEPVTTLAEAQAVIAIYALRPRIEDFHLALKSGCRVEHLELETAERLQKALVAYSGIAVRLVALRDLARQEPDAPCTRVVSEEDWQALWIHFEGSVPPAGTRPPTVEQVIKWLGRLGGHLGRKRDGMPGVRTLWRGWRDLRLLVEGYRAGRRQRDGP